MYPCEGHGELSEGRSGAGDEGTRSDLASDGEEDQLVAGGRDPRHQRPADAAVAGAVRSAWLRRPDRSAAWPAQRIPVALVGQVLGLYRERYFDLIVLLDDATSEASLKPRDGPAYT
jgi:hypothetical protein